MSFIKNRKIIFTIASILGLASIAALLVFGLKPGIDFTGGSIMEVEYKDARPETADINSRLADLKLGELSLQTVGEQGLMMRMKELDENVHQQILGRLSENSNGERVAFTEKRFESIGSVVGKELRDKTATLIVLSLLLIVGYIAIAFRKVARPCKSWQYGLVSLVTMFYDILLPLSVFAVLGKLYGVEISIAVIIALLTVIGYTINDKVVVFDRIRENLARGAGASFQEIVDISIKQTLTRSINTSFTLIVSLAALLVFGGDTLKYFSLALLLGVVAGTCSSIFLAGPMLVSWVGWRERRRLGKRKR